MNAKELRSKSSAELSDELLKLRKEQFSLRMQRATGQTVKPTDFSRVRKDVARLKTIVRQQQIAAGGVAAVAAPAPESASARARKSGSNEKRK
jgi:large subunit ribosomal protein L29